MKRRALLIVNPCARSAQQCLPELLAKLTEMGLELLDASSEEGSLSQIVLRHKSEADLVILAGGDGTLNGAADGLVRADLPLGIIPLGTANDLARTLGIPDDLLSACQVIEAGHVRKIDVGSVNGKHFFNVASIGLSVDITRNLTPETKRRWGVLAYLKTSLATARRARPFSAQVRHPGGLHKSRTLQIAVGNGRFYGGGMAVNETAVIDDAALDLYSVEVANWWQLARLLPALRRGTLDASDRVLTLRAGSFEVTTRRARPVNTDGEITTETPAKFHVIPQALKVYVPADSNAAGLSDA